MSWYGTSDRGRKNARAVVSKRRRLRTSAANTIGIINYDEIYDRTKGYCRCGVYVRRDVAHFDHIKPLALGGRHSSKNLRVSCADCNLEKGAKEDEPKAAKGKGSGLSRRSTLKRKTPLRRKKRELDPRCF